MLQSNPFHTLYALVNLDGYHSLLLSWYGDGIFHNPTKLGYAYIVAYTTKTLFGSTNDVEDNIISRKPRQATHHQPFKNQ